MTDPWMYPDDFGKRDAEQSVIDSMFQPVRCARCQQIYDLGTVEIVARHSDCSVWLTPCCRSTVDDRGETGWTSRADYRRLTKSGGA